MGVSVQGGTYPGAFFPTFWVGRLLAIKPLRTLQHALVELTPGNGHPCTTQTGLFAQETLESSFTARPQ